MSEVHAKRWYGAVVIAAVLVLVGSVAALAQSREPLALQLSESASVDGVSAPISVELVEPQTSATRTVFLHQTAGPELASLRLWVIFDPPVADASFELTALPGSSSLGGGAGTVRPVRLTVDTEARWFGTVSGEVVAELPDGLVAAGKVVMNRRAEPSYTVTGSGGSAVSNVVRLPEACLPLTLVAGRGGTRPLEVSVVKITEPEGAGAQLDVAGPLGLRNPCEVLGSGETTEASPSIAALGPGESATLGLEAKLPVKGTYRWNVMLSDDEHRITQVSVTVERAADEPAVEFIGPLTRQHTILLRSPASFRFDLRLKSGEGSLKILHPRFRDLSQVGSEGQSIRRLAIRGLDSVPLGHRGSRIYGRLEPANAVPYGFQLHDVDRPGEYRGTLVIEDAGGGQLAVEVGIFVRRHWSLLVALLIVGTLVAVGYRALTDMSVWARRARRALARVQSEIDSWPVPPPDTTTEERAETLRQKLSEKRSDLEGVSVWSGKNFGEALTRYLRDDRSDPAKRAETLLSLARVVPRLLELGKLYDELHEKIELDAETRAEIVEKLQRSFEELSKPDAILAAGAESVESIVERLSEVRTTLTHAVIAGLLTKADTLGKGLEIYEPIVKSRIDDAFKMKVVPEVESARREIRSGRFRRADEHLELAETEFGRLLVADLHKKVESDQGINELGKYIDNKRYPELRRKVNQELGSTGRGFLDRYHRGLEVIFVYRRLGLLDAAKGNADPAIVAAVTELNKVDPNADIVAAWRVADEASRMLDAGVRRAESDASRPEAYPALIRGGLWSGVLQEPLPRTGADAAEPLWLDHAFLIVGIVLSSLVGFLALYGATWGTPADLVSAVLWAFGIQTATGVIGASLLREILGWGRSGSKPA